MDLSHINEFPYRLECGTLNTLGVAGLNAGLKWIQSEGLERIHANEMQLWHLLKAGLEQLDGVVSYCTDRTGPRTAVLSMNLAGWLPADLGMVLDVDHGIAVRTGLQCAPLVHEQIGTIASKGTVRFSLGPFNTPEQVGTILSALREIAS
jgi:selenocysteine lyase/cysteine desulfurase